MGWFDVRFQERTGATQVNCAVCERAMWFPPSRAADYKTCGGECAAIFRQQAAEERTRPCETCGKDFTPRRNQLAKGGGRYCSQKCNAAFHASGQTAEVWEARKQTIRAMRARGEWTILRGENNPRWKGGRKASVRRWIESGKSKEDTRRYRQNNPDKVREFSKIRRGLMSGRLPQGAIQRIRAAQRNRCAICATRLRNGDHLDHITPLARGGRHVPANLQLLCPPCNLRKSDRDPIEHMQSLGRLL